MPPPRWNWAPRRKNGQLEQGFDRRSPYQKQIEPIQPSEYPQWSPPPTVPAGGRVSATEPGGGMLRRPGMNGMGDFFTYPAQQGVTPQDFMQQAVQSGSLPPPPPPWAVQGEPMEESQLYRTAAPRPRAGSMAWESGPAPFDQPHVPGWSGPAAPPPLAPGEVEPRIAQMQARQIDAQHKKSLEAAQAAKVAADNAIRAASAGAPKVAATNAATAQAAANVAATVSKDPEAQRAAAVAQSEATKAVAAANVAANNASKGGNGSGGMNDWLELSGLGSGLEASVAGQFKVKHALYGAGLLGLAYFGYRYWKNR